MAEALLDVLRGELSKVNLRVYLVLLSLSFVVIIL